MKFVFVIIVCIASGVASAQKDAANYYYDDIYEQDEEPRGRRKTSDFRSLFDLTPEQEQMMVSESLFKL